MTVQVAPHAALTVAGLSAPVRTGAAQLDAGAVPYGTADVELALADALALVPSLNLAPSVSLAPSSGGGLLLDPEEIDPRQNIRASLVVGDHNGEQRSFDLSVRTRTVDHKAKTIRLSLATDEAILQRFSPLLPDDAATAHQSSVRGVVNYVLGKIGAQLAAGGPDSDFSVAADATNYVSNPAAAVDTSGWSANSTMDRRPASTWFDNFAKTGFRLYGFTNDATKFMDYGWPNNTQFAGRTFLVRARLRTGTDLTNRGADAGRLRVFYSTNGGQSFVTGPSGVATTAIGATGDVSFLVSFPPGTNHVVLRAHHGWGSGGIVIWSDFRVSEYTGDPTDIGYFDGSTPTSSLYLHEWDGPSGLARSNRRALIDRSPDLLNWQPGVNAWQFLEPITASVGLRLFCDEHRVWRLVRPDEYFVDGIVTAAGFNTVEGTDTVTADDPEVFCTGVIVQFRWRDAKGVEREANDTAGTPQSVLVVELNRPYAPGIAAAILTRRAGQGRVQDVYALADWTVTPAMQSQISLPGTVDQVGTLASVEWGLSTGLMRLGARGLTEAAAGTWLGWNASQQWGQVPDALTWEGA